jgi:hypothetical protein
MHAFIAREWLGDLRACFHVVLTIEIHGYMAAWPGKIRVLDEGPHFTARRGDEA